MTLTLAGPVSFSFYTEKLHEVSPVVESRLLRVGPPVANILVGWPSNVSLEVNYYQLP